MGDGDYREDAQAAMRSLLDIPEQITVRYFLAFGPAAAKPYKRHRRPMGEIEHWNRYDLGRFMSDAELENWTKTRHHRVMYRDASPTD